MVLVHIPALIAKALIPSLYPLRLALFDPLTQVGCLTGTRPRADAAMLCYTKGCTVVCAAAGPMAAAAPCQQLSVKCTTRCRRADLHPCAALALLLQIPADMLLMHIFIPFTVEHVRVKGAVKAAVQAWLRLVARWAFGQPTGRGVFWLSPWHTVLWVLQAVSAADT